MSLCLREMGAETSVARSLGEGKLENEEGSSAHAAAELFETIFSTGLIAPPHGAETPTPLKAAFPYCQEQPIRRDR